jgi:hypothetical protein
MCNQYGISEERTSQLIIQKFQNTIAVRDEFPSLSAFESKVQVLIKDAYGRFAGDFNSWHQNEAVNDETPTLPEEIHAVLPPILKNLMPHFDEGRGRDVFLLSALGVLSSCFPAVQGSYDNNLVGMNLFLFISAPASAGKGVMNWARRLGTEMQKDCESRYRLAMCDYEAALAAYKEGIAQGQQVEAPVKPERQLFFIPANTSASKLIQALKSNGNFGVMFDSEADTLSQALGKDFGGFSDILRKIFHHEAIELQRKMNDEYVSLEKTFLSVVLSGTPDQIKNLLASVENGFFSRFIFYDFPLSLTWKNVFDRSAESPDGAFESAAIQLRHHAVAVGQKAADNGGIIPFALNPEQEVRFMEWFTAKQEQLHHLYGDQIIASVRRLGLITFRIAMILTVIRSMRSQVPTKFVCADVDFETALELTNALLSHTTKVYNRLQRHRKMKSAAGRKAVFLEKLPDTFKRATAMEIASLLNIKEKTAENYLAGLITDGVLERLEHNHYQKI